VAAGHKPRQCSTPCSRVGRIPHQAGVQTPHGFPTPIAETSPSTFARRGSRRGPGNRLKTGVGVAPGAAAGGPSLRGGGGAVPLPATVQRSTHHTAVGRRPRRTTLRARLWMRERRRRRWPGGPRSQRSRILRNSVFLLF